MIQFVMNNQLNKFGQYITSSLEEQDSLRKFAVREKELAAEIKRLQNEKQQENKDHQNEQKEKQKTIQSLKEKLLYKTHRAELKRKYDEKVAGAKENTQQRIFDYKQKDIEAEITYYSNKLATEEQVHRQLKDYLVRKEVDCAFRKSDRKSPRSGRTSRTRWRTRSAFTWRSRSRS